MIWVKFDLILCVNKEILLFLLLVFYDVKVFDGVVIVYVFLVLFVVMFFEYVDFKFLFFLENYLKSIKWIDVVWDEYWVVSLKEFVFEKRGKGVRWKVVGYVKLF